jgi:hypothetical protein
MTKIQKEIDGKRIRYTPQIEGKTVKSCKVWGRDLCIMFTDDTFICITFTEEYDGFEFEFDRYLDSVSMKFLGLITDEQYVEDLKRQEQARKASETSRDKREYERLKKVFEGGK